MAQKLYVLRFLKEPPPFPPQVYISRGIAQYVGSNFGLHVIDEMEVGESDPLCRVVAAMRDFQERESKYAH